MPSATFAAAPVCWACWSAVFFCVQAPSRNASAAAVHRRRIFPFTVISLEPHQVRERVLIHGVAKIRAGQRGHRVLYRGLRAAPGDVQGVSLAECAVVAERRDQGAGLEAGGVARRVLERVLLGDVRRGRVPETPGAYRIPSRYRVDACTPPRPTPHPDRLPAT